VDLTPAKGSLSTAMKRAAPQDFEAKRAAGGGSIIAIKFLVPERYGRGLIGKAGSTIAKLKEVSGGDVKVSTSGEVFGGAAAYPHRQIAISGPTVEAVHQAFGAALGKVAEMSESGWGEMGADTGIALQVILPRGVASRVIGKGGATSVQLRQTFGVKLSVQASRSAEQIALITGPLESIDPLIGEFIQYISEDGTVQPSYAGLTVEGRGGGGGGMEPVHKGGKGGVYTGPPPRPMQPHSGGWGAGSYSEPYAIGAALGAPVGAGAPVGTESWQAAVQAAPHVLGVKTEVTVQIPDELVSKVIGKSGAVIKELQQRTGIFSRIDTNAPPGSKPLLLSGPLIGVQAAHVWVMAIIADGAAPAAAPSKGKGKGKGWGY